MPRIRTLKPEHKQHRKVGPLSDRAYRLWVGMITEADDEGRVVAEPSQLRALIFPYHPRVTAAHVETALREIEATGLIRRYVVDSSTNGRDSSVVYADFPSWRDHQKIDKDKPSRLPPYEASTTIRRHVDDTSLPFDDTSTTSRDSSLGIKDQGREGIKDQGRESGSVDSSSTPATAPTQFQINDAITAALNRCATLGAARRLRDPAWWQAEVRANASRGVDFAGELLKAEAWIATNPRRAPVKDHARFMHAWFARVDERSGNGHAL